MDGVKTGQLKINLAKKEIIKQIRMNINPEKRNVLEKIYIELLQNQIYYNPSHDNHF